MVVRDADGDGAVDSGESVSITVTVRNVGDAPSVDVRGQLNGDGAIAVLGDLPPGAARGTLADGMEFDAVAGPCGDALQVGISDQIGTAVSVSVAVSCAEAPLAEKPAANSEAVGCGCEQGRSTPWVWAMLLVVVGRRLGNKP